MGFGESEVFVSYAQIDESLNPDFGNDFVSFSDPISVTNFFTTQFGFRASEHVRDVADVDGDGNVDLIGIGFQNVSVRIEGSFQDGDDFINGEDGNDELHGGTGNDTIEGGRDNDILFGDAGDDDLEGEPGADQLYGGTGNDRLEGGTGADQLFGEADDDFLDGGTGADLLDGGHGNDTFIVDNLGDVVVERAGQGFDDEVITSVDFTLPDHVENLSSAQNLQSDANLGGTGLTLTGNDLDNTIIATFASDVINGGAGADFIQAFQGNDVIRGGLGADDLLGGLGADTFVFDLGDSLAGSNTFTERDEIRDFESGQDLIDLSSFGTSFIQSRQFGGVEGQVRVVSTNNEFAANEVVVLVDVDGDRNADFSLEVSSTISDSLSLTESDFILG